MALQSDELFGAANSQLPNLRAYPDQDGVRPGQLEQLGADADIAHLTPMSQNSAGTYRVWSEGVSEVSTMTADGTPASAGTFTLIVDGAITAPIAFDATAADVQAALEALPNVAPGDVVGVATTGLNLGVAAAVVTLTWGGAYQGLDVALSADQTLISAGTDFVLAEATAGSGGSTEIDALMWAPGDPHKGLLAGESLMQRFLAGVVHAADVPLPAGESQGDLDSALKSMLLRQKGIKVTGLSLGA